MKKVEKNFIQLLHLMEIHPEDCDVYYYKMIYGWINCEAILLGISIEQSKEFQLRLDAIRDKIHSNQLPFT
jgi:hypothetical protein